MDKWSCQMRFRASLRGMRPIFRSWVSQCRYIQLHWLLLRRSSPSSRLRPTLLTWGADASIPLCKEKLLCTDLGSSTTRFKSSRWLIQKISSSLRSSVSRRMDYWAFLIAIKMWVKSSDFTLIKHGSWTFCLRSRDRSLSWKHMVLGSFAIIKCSHIAEHCFRNSPGLTHMPALLY